MLDEDARSRFTRWISAPAEGTEEFELEDVIVLLEIFYHETKYKDNFGKNASRTYNLGKFLFPDEYDDTKHDHTLKSKEKYFTYLCKEKKRTNSKFITTCLLELCQTNSRLKNDTRFVGGVVALVHYLHYKNESEDRTHIIDDAVKMVKKRMSPEEIDYTGLAKDIKEFDPSKARHNCDAR